MHVVENEKKEKLQQSLKEISLNDGIKNEQKLAKALSVIDSFTRSNEGLRLLYDHIPEIIQVGMFEGTNWEHPEKLVPSLVKGTLCAGFPLIVYETLSELRILRIAMGDLEETDISKEEALQFLQESIIASFSLAFEDLTEELRIKLSNSERKRIKLLFDFIISHIPIKNLKNKLAKEISTIAQQRPIMTDKLEDILHLVNNNMELNGDDESEVVLLYFLDALFHPTNNCRKFHDLEDYNNFLKGANKNELLEEATQMGEKMSNTGLVSRHHVYLLRELASKYPQVIAKALFLDQHGRAELERHRAFVCEMIEQFVIVENKQVVYGLGRLLSRNLLSRKALWNALNKIFRIKLHPDIKTLLLKSRATRTDKNDDIAEKLLCSGAISILGQPLGIGQGMNPTCQSARGISMWSKHSPEKLLNMIINVAVSNQLNFRYEGEMISSERLGGQKSFDLNMDTVSIVLVPHLDNIYQQMMSKAMLKHPLEDPHVSVNPAFYGHWIQTGFISCYNPAINAIQDYNDFVKLFYASFHPLYNGDFDLIYPIPLGIFITSAHGDFLGFHAVSLLRVKEDPNDQWRAYFFNPNNEGRQNWGQGIVPSVDGKGEKHGESSLPFYQFASRVYAFHYNSLEAENYTDQVEDKIIEKIKALAKTSWGKIYIWTQ